MIFNSVKEKFIFYSLPIILFSLIPFFLITGPFLSDLSISLISFLFLIYCLKKKNFSYFSNKYFYFFLIFCIYLIFNTLINNFNLDSFKISLFFFRYGVFVVAAVNLLNVDNKNIKYLFFCIFTCFLVLILDGFYEYFNGKNILGLKYHPSRVSSFFGDELILGSYLSRIWPIFFGLLLLIIKNKNIFFLSILILILSEILIFLSGERVAFFYINLSAIFVILFSKKLLKFRLLILLSSILIIILITLINPIAKKRIFDQTLDSMNLTSDRNEKKFIFSVQHEELYTVAYKIFLDNKIIGVGVKNFRKFCKDEKYYNNQFSCNSHPHNAYIQILSETGIVGFLFILVIFFYFSMK